MGRIQSSGMTVAADRLGEGGDLDGTRHVFEEGWSIQSDFESDRGPAINALAAPVASR